MDYETTDTAATDAANVTESDLRRRLDLLDRHGRTGMAEGWPAHLPPIGRVFGPVQAARIAGWTRAALGGGER
jgi:hypothetical protein